MISSLHEVENKKIQVVDDFISMPELVKIRFIISEVPLIRGGSTLNEDSQSLHYASSIDPAKMKSFPFVRTLEEQTSLLLERPMECNRVTYREFVFGDHLSYHQDSTVEGVGTAVIYFNDKWNDNFHGETMFMDKNGVGLSVLPRPFRAVIFDGRIFHCTNPPSRTYYDARKLLVLNFKSK